MVNKKRVKRTLPDQVLNLDVPIDVLVEQLEKLGPMDDIAPSKDPNEIKPPTPTVQNLTDWVPSEHGSRYVVIRGGLRVSDNEYLKADEPKAIAEKDFWQKVIKRWPDGTKVEIVQYDKKKHRIW